MTTKMRSKATLEAPFDPARFPLVERGHCFEDFAVGQVWVHHWGRTLTTADNVAFSTATAAWHPLYLNVEAARAEGHPAMVMNPMLVLCVTFGLSVEDLSEMGGPFVGLDTCTFHRPGYAGDTVTATSTVVDARPSNSRPRFGIVTWATEGRNQHGEVLVSFQRTNLVAKRASA